MTRLTCVLLLIGCATAHADGEPLPTEHKFRELTLAVHHSWKKETPKSKMRLGQFRLPAAKGQKHAELAIFVFGKQAGIDPNIKRWVGQFQPAGRKAKISSGVSRQGKYYFVEISGTYNAPVGGPMSGKHKATPNSRMLGVIIEKKGGLYFLKAAGADTTIAAQANALRAAFGGDAKQEKPYTTK